MRGDRALRYILAGAGDAINRRLYGAHPPDTTAIPCLLRTPLAVLYRLWRVAIFRRNSNNKTIRRVKKL